MAWICLCRRARKKRASEDSDSDEAGSDTEAEGSDVEMADVNALAGKHRKSDASEAQDRASRLSARTRAKVCGVPLQNGNKLTNLRLQERLSNGSAKDGEAVSDG